VASADDILALVKASSYLVSSPQTLEDAELLRFLNGELIGVLSLLKAINEEYLVVSKDVTYSSGAASVAIPSRALAGTLRTVEVVESSIPRPLKRIEPTQNHEYVEGPGWPLGYMLRGSRVHLLPVPSSNTTLRLTFMQRPGKVVLEEAAAQITALDSGTGVLTFASLPTTHVTATDYDFVGQATPYATVAIDQTATGATSTTLTFASLPTELAVGDWVALAEQSPFPSIPSELDPLLAQAIICRWLSAAGNSAAGGEFKTLERMRTEASALLAPRSIGSIRPLVNRYGPGFRRVTRRVT
jgi:hypothetical protein